MTTPQRLSLTLYFVSGHDASQRAEDRLRAVLEAAADLEYELEMVDLGADPERAEQDRILACPTIVKREPGPVRRIIGDLGSPELVRQAIGLA